MSHRDPTAMSLHDVLFDLSNGLMVSATEGNPGAVTVLASLPDSEDGVAMLGALIDNQLTGARLWLYYTKVCNKQMQKLHGDLVKLVMDDVETKTKVANHVMSCPSS